MRGFGSLWVAEFRRDRVVRLDPSTRREQASVALALPEPLVTGDSKFLPSSIATGAGGIWVSTARGYVARVDPVTNRVTAMVKTAFDATGDVAVGEGGVWVGESGHLARIDPDTLALSRIELVGPNGLRIGIGPVAVCPNVVRVAGGLLRTSREETGHRSYTFKKRGAAIAEIHPVTRTVLSIHRTSRQPIKTARSLCDRPR